MSATRKRFHCPSCGSGAIHPSDWTPKSVANACAICRYHTLHKLEHSHDGICAICLARLWQARLRALRILLFYRAWLREEL